MIPSRPDNTQRVMPRLKYRDAAAAIEFLSRVFGFAETARFEQGGQIIIAEMAWQGEIVFALASGPEGTPGSRDKGGPPIEMFCYVDDVDGHHSKARAAGATILSPPEDKFWGVRSYDALDTEGYRWTFRRLVKYVALPDSTPKRAQAGPSSSTSAR
jgi:uncharacterized glyoxalase superfamily protein PhnB